MKKHQVRLQRALGEILSRIPKEDRDILEDYMDMLEQYVYKYESDTPVKTSRVEYGVEGSSMAQALSKPIPDCYTANITESFKGNSKKPLKSKSFTEDEINLAIFDIVANSSVDEVLITEIFDLKDLSRDTYMKLRNVALIGLHNKKKQYR